MDDLDKYVDAQDEKFKPLYDKALKRKAIKEAGFLSYSGGIDSGLPRKQLITPEAIPDGEYNLGELGNANTEAPVESDSPINNDIVSAIVSIQKVREAMAVLQESSVSLESLFNGMFGAESKNLSELGASLNQISDMLSEKMLHKADKLGGQSAFLAKLLLSAKYSSNDIEKEATDFLHKS